MPNRFIIYLSIYLVFMVFQFVLTYSNLIDLLFYSFIVFVFFKEYFYVYQKDLFSDSHDVDIPKYRELITVETFYNLVEAYLLLDLFDQNEIEATILGEMHGNVNPLIISAIGGFQLQVSIDKVDKAIECLDLFKETQLMNPIIACPKCESINVKEEYKWWPLSLLFILITMTPPPKEVGFKCKNCENRWNKLSEYAEVTVPGVEGGEETGE